MTNKEGELLWRKPKRSEDIYQKLIPVDLTIKVSINKSELNRSRKWTFAKTYEEAATVKHLIEK